MGLGSELMRVLEDALNGLRLPAGQIDGQLGGAQLPPPGAGVPYAGSAHTHPLADVEQSGASVGQVATWTGSAWAPAAPGGGGVTDGDKGDIVVSGGGSVWSFDSGVVTVWARTLLAAVDAAGARLILGLGTAATQAATAFAAAVHTHPAADVTDLQEAVEDRIGASLVAGANVTISYDDTSGKTTIAASSGGGGGGVFPRFAAHRGGTGQSATNNAFTVFVGTVEDWDTAGAYATSTGRFQPTTAGYYLMTGVLRLDGGTVADAVIAIFKNGSELRRGSGMAAAMGGNAQFVVSTEVYLNGSTDYVELAIFHNSGGARTIHGNSSLSYFSGARQPS